MKTLNSKHMQFAEKNWPCNTSYLWLEVYVNSYYIKVDKYKNCTTQSAVEYTYQQKICSLKNYIAYSTFSYQSCIMYMYKQNLSLTQHKSWCVVKYNQTKTNQSYHSQA